LLRKIYILVFVNPNHSAPDLSFGRNTQPLQTFHAGYPSCIQIQGRMESQYFSPPVSGEGLSWTFGRNNSSRNGNFPYANHTLEILHTTDRSFRSSICSREDCNSREARTGYRRKMLRIRTEYTG